MAVVAVRAEHMYLGVMEIDYTTCVREDDRPPVADPCSVFVEPWPDGLKHSIRRTGTCGAKGVGNTLEWYMGRKMCSI